MREKTIKLLKTALENVKPTVPLLIFNGKKGSVNKKIDFEEFMKTKEKELRASWLQEEETKRVPVTGPRGMTWGWP
jgi:hypothetical protein